MLLAACCCKEIVMVHQTKEKPAKWPPNRAQRPRIWQDGMAEVKETYRRVALVKHTGFTVWDDARKGPTLERILRWNRQARNLSQVPKSLRAKIPTRFLKELQNNRSQSGYESQAHLQNVRGMCKRIQSQKSVTERKKNLHDPAMYPVFVRRPPTASFFVDSELDTSSSHYYHHHNSRRRPHSSPSLDSLPLSYTPHPFKLLFDICNGPYPFCSFAKRPRSGASSNPLYGKLFSRSSSSCCKKSVLDIAEALDKHRVSSAPADCYSPSRVRQQQRRRRLSSSSCATTTASPPTSASPLGSSARSKCWLEGAANLVRRREEQQPENNNKEDAGGGGGGGGSRPPSRCTNRPASSRSSWRLNLVEPPVLGDLSNRSTYSDCVSLDSMGMPVLFSASAWHNDGSNGEELCEIGEVSVPKRRLRGGGGRSSPGATTTSSALIVVDQSQQQQQQMAGFSSCSEDEESSLKVALEKQQQHHQRRPFTANVPPLMKETPLVAAAASSTTEESSTVESYSGCDWRPQSASNALLGRRCSRVTFASPVESSSRRWEKANKAKLGGITTANSGSGIESSSSEEEQQAEVEQVVEAGAGAEVSSREKENSEEGGGGAACGDDGEEVVIKHSSNPYADFKSSMMNMIDGEGLQEQDRELEELFQYYMDLNPKMHHPILARVISDIKKELKERKKKKNTQV